MKLLRKILKTMSKEEKSTAKIVSSTKIKLNNTEYIIYIALTDYEINHEEFILISNEAEEYSKLKESIRMMIKQRADTEGAKPNRDGKRMGIYIYYIYINL